MQGTVPKEIHAIPTETLACFLPGRAKDLSAPLYGLHEMFKMFSQIQADIQSVVLRN